MPAHVRSTVLDRRPDRRWLRRGMTLGEVLLLLALLLVLVALALPALARVRSNGQQTRCSGVLLRVGWTTQGYANVYRGQLPPLFFRFSPGKKGNTNVAIQAASEEESGLAIYSEAERLCPADDHPSLLPIYGDSRISSTPFSWGFNIELCGLDTRILHKRQRDSELISFFDGAMGGGLDGRNNIQGHYADSVDFVRRTRRSRHGDAANFLYLDGHVASATDVDAAQVLLRRGAGHRTEPAATAPAAE